MQITGIRKSALIAFLAVDALIVVVLVILFQLRGDRQSEAQLREIGVTIYPEARGLSDFRLLDQDGEFFTKSDFQGHWNLVFFGFTHCPDICPLTMAELRQFYEGLDFDQVEKPRVFLVTVDPRRDNPESMAAYLQNYHADFIGLSGDPAQIAQLASELYVTYSETTSETQNVMSHDHETSPVESPAADEPYLIQHSGHIAVINPQGDYYAVMRAPHRDRDLTTAYRKLAR
ncbi:MAG: SCO family protein [Pseudohongiellaceae bacterium]